MRTLELLAALALTAAPAMAMNSSRGHQSLAQDQSNAASATVTPMSPQQCLRRVDARGNIHVICPNMREARAAWIMRRPSYPGNYVVFYHDRGRVRVWRQWTRPMPRRR